MAFTPKPAPISKRVTAGFIDSAFLAVLSGITFVVPLMVKGIVLPMWGVLAVLLGYSVVPIAFFKRTLGLHIMGLEVVGKTGHPLDLVNATFREMLGRGFFPFAYLVVTVASLVAMNYRVGTTIAPPTLVGVMTCASATALIVASMGHLVAFGRPDQRTLADLISGSFVVEGRALPLPTDPDELDELAANRRRVVRNVVIFELLCIVAVFASPYIVTTRFTETTAEKGARMRIDALRSKFNTNPESASLAANLQDELLRSGRGEEAKQVADKHREALSLKEARREETLRARLAEKRDREVAQELIALLEQQDRVDEAREAYLQWLGETPTPSELAGFGHWLATNGKTEEAITVLTTATTQDPLVPYGHTLLGVSLQRMGRAAMAREELELALLDDPDDEDAADALREVNEQLGALSAGDRAKLKRRFDAWARDAGR
jgi:uncharacterized RDD family membrane protein YckC